MPHFTVQAEDDAAAEDVQFINQALQAYNRVSVPPINDGILTVFARDESGEISGGLVGWTYKNWMHISALWVDQNLRGQGLGKRVLEAAETEAKSRGCTGVHLDTFTFQAPEFYEALGYTVFGSLEGYFGDHTRFFYRKSLV